MEIDDPVGAIAVHGPPGAFGTICVAIFAKPHCLSGEKVRLPIPQSTAHTSLSVLNNILKNVACNLSQHAVWKGLVYGGGSAAWELLGIQCFGVLALAGRAHCCTLTQDL
eukprot:5899764-Amphidinium_carterae.1